MRGSGAPIDPRVGKKFLQRHRIAAFTVLLAAAAVLLFGAIALAQQGEDPPIPPTMPEPPGKPQYDGTLPPDPLKTPTSRICDSTPDLCELAPNVGAAFARQDLAAFTRLLTASEAECRAPGAERPDPGLLCEGQPAGTIVSGFTVTGLGKQATLLPESEFRELLASWLELPGKSSATPKPVSIGCAITRTEVVDCSVTAVAIGLYYPKQDSAGATIVLFFRKDYGGQPFGLVGGSGGLPDGAVLTGGTERRILAGWTGNETGDWYFELLD